MFQIHYSPANGARRRLTKPAGKRFRKRQDRDKDSESGSLREYDDHADMMRFLEDGSFIGQYCGYMRRSELVLSENVLSASGTALSSAL